jgi:hypothetical protein
VISSHTVGIDSRGATADFPAINQDLCVVLNSLMLKKIRGPGQLEKQHQNTACKRGRFGPVFKTDFNFVFKSWDRSGL